MKIDSMESDIKSLTQTLGISRPEAELVRALTENTHIDIPTLTTTN